jgi:hypothetical protein
MKIIKALILGCILLLSACSPLQQLQRLQKKHPYLFEVKPNDTFYVRTSKTDTLRYYNSSTDTIQVITDSLTIMQIFTRDTFRYYYKSRPCSTFTTRQVIQPKTFIHTDSKIETYLLYFVLIFAIALLWKMLR